MPHSPSPTKKLEQTLSELEQANQLKDAFLANMSHELRTPMNGVLSFADLLMDTQLDNTQQQYVNMIRESSELLLHILNDILDISKIESGKLELEATSFNLQDMLHNAVELVEARIRQQPVEIITRVDGDLPQSMLGDQTRVRQILINLIGNAAKFTDEGHIYINLSQEISPADDKVMVRCEIEDTGPGISLENQTLIFEDFQQADSSMTRRYGGTGLGLSICRKLVELMGGTIGVESQPDEGAKFWFTLPLEINKEHAKTLNSIPTFTGLRVIAVDDVSLNTQIYAELLSRWGVAFTQVSTAEQCLQALKDGARKHKPYQIALIDYQLPGLSGLELAQHIQDDYRLKDTLMVMITAMAEPEQAQRFREAGFAAYLRKPLNQQTLQHVMTVLWAAHQHQQKPAFMTIHDTCDPSENIAPQHDNRLVLKSDARILLVEDNPVNQLAASAILKKMGCTVELAATGVEGVQKAMATSYDLIFMDCQMPEMNGYDATLEIRRREQESDIHRVIVAMTANAMLGDRERCLEVGMDDYLPKPARPANIIQMLTRWLPPTRVQYVEAEDLAPHNGPLPANTDENEQPAINAHALAELQLMLAEQFGAAIETFLATSDTMMKALEEALHNEETAPVIEHTHSLKSMCQQVGAHDLARSVSLLHGMAKEDSIPLEAGRHLWIRLADQYSQACSELHQYTQSDSTRRQA